MSSSMTGASYTNAFVYTHLGQLWQGPLNGSSTSYRYFYCGSAPHQLSGLYSTGTTCANKASAVYQSSYNAWGDVTGRTYPSATSVTLAYDSLDHFVRWTTGTGSNEFYAYDSAGNRVLCRSTSGGTTTMTVYAFGLEEHLYSGTGTSQGNTYYYSLAGRLIGELTGTTPKTNIFLTDALGSVLATFSNTAGTAALLGNQVYGPYGTQRYSSGGTMGTNKGFTGQYNDSLTGLDYYNARYYDPVVGVFLAADTVQGNPQGLNPYAYVGGNPETKNDPTGNGPFDPPLVIGLLGATMIVGPPMLGLAILGVTVIVIFYAPSATDQNYPSNGPQRTPAPTPTETQTPTPTPSTDTNGGMCKTGGCYDLGKAQGYTYTLDRKSTRLNSSHQIISYAVFCLKKKIDYLVVCRESMFRLSLVILEY